MRFRQLVALVLMLVLIPLATESPSAASPLYDLETATESAPEMLPPPPGDPSGFPMPDGAPAPLGAGLGPSDEIVERRTLGSKTFVGDSPGHFVTKAHSAPIHYSGANGVMRDLDASLSLGVDGWLRNTAAYFQLAITPLASADEVARLAIDDQHSVAFGFGGAATSVGVPGLKDVRFANVWPETDVVLTSTNRGLKEDLYLRSAAAPTTFTYPLRLRGLTARLNPAGDVEFLDEANAVRARIPHGYMVEAQGDDPSIEPAENTSGVSYSLVDGATGPSLRMTLDSAWLQAPGRNFPVRVDPILLPQPQAWFDDTNVITGYTRDATGDLELRVGTYRDETGTHTTRSFLHFDLSGVNYKHINFGQLYLWLYAANSSCASPQWMDVVRVTSDWTGSQVNNFATPPSPFLDAASPIHRSAFSAGNGCPAAYQVLDTTNAVRKWAAQTWPNKGVALLASPPNETDVATYKKFNSENSGRNVPLYNIDWSNPVPGIPDQLSPANGSLVRTATLSARYTDPEGQNNGYVYFRIRKLDPSTNQSTTVSQGYGSMAAPGGRSTYTASLGDGTYYWETFANNNYATSGWSATQTFTVDGTPPPPPTEVTTNVKADTTTRNRVIGASWATVTETGSGVVGYSWTFNNTANTPAGTAVTAGDAKTYSANSATLGDGTWYFHVRAIDKAGNASSNVVYGPMRVASVAPPTAPIDVAASPEALKIGVYWSPPMDGGGTPITQYVVKQFDVATNQLLSTATACGSCTSHVFEGVPPTASHYYTVAAVNAQGTGPVARTNNTSSVAAVAFACAANNLAEGPAADTDPDDPDGTVDDYTYDRIDTLLGLDKLVPQLISTFGNRYGGVWVDRRGTVSAMCVGLVDSTPADLETIAAMTAGPVDRIGVASVRYSDTQLERFKAQVTSAIKQAQGKLFTSARIAADPEANAVRVVTDVPDPVVELAVRTVVPADAVVFESNGAEGVFRQSRNNYPPYQAGLRIKNHDLNSGHPFDCTLGFLMRTKPNSNWPTAGQMVGTTAGHCGEYDERWFSPSGNLLGQVKKDMAPQWSSDWQVDALAFPLATQPPSEEAQLFSGSKRSRPVSRQFPKTNPIKRTRVCFSGGATNKQACGPVHDVNADVMVENCPGNDDADCTEQWLHHQWCFYKATLEGDSGAPVYQVNDPGVNAAGLVSVGYDRGQGSAQPDSCFSHIHYIQEWLEATLVTTNDARGVDKGYAR